MRKFFLLIIFSFFLSCNFNETFLNREIDKREAEKVTIRFYSIAQNGNLEKASLLFSNTFFQFTGKSKLNLLFDGCKKKYGKVLNYSISEWKTKVTEGENRRAEYLLIYNVHRSIKDTQEIFSLVKENDSIKINGYQINNAK